MDDYEILGRSRFYMEMRVDGSNDRIDAYFNECNGFKRSQEIVEFCEVTPQKWGRNGTTSGRVVRTKLPGNVTSGNLTLKYGMSTSKSFWEWFKAIEDGNWAKQRRDGDLVVYDTAHIEAARFRFLGAWPVNYKVSELQAGSKEFSIVDLELAVDEFIRIK